MSQGSATTSACRGLWAALSDELSVEACLDIIILGPISEIRQIEWVMSSKGKRSEVMSWP